MSVIVPIENDTSQCIEFIFENAEKMPNDFYINIMNLIKYYHDYGNNYFEIHGFLELNKNKVDNSILNEIKKHIKPPPPPPVPRSVIVKRINCNITWCIDYNLACCRCCVSIFSVVFLLSFVGVIAWCFATRK